ncbi:hypothetical protein ACEE21_15420 [Clostridium baratii]
MGKIVVVNKLNLGRETLGYRFDIKDGSDKLISFDIAEENAKNFLKMVGKEKIKRGSVIQGRLSNGLFITDAGDNILEVKNGTQAREIINKYILATDKEVDNVLNEVGKPENYTVKGNIQILDSGRFEFSDCVEIREEYDKMVKSGKGLTINLSINEVQDAESGEFKFSVYVSNVVDLFKYIYNLAKLGGRKSISYRGYIGNNKGVLNLDIGNSLNEFIKKVSEKVDINKVTYMEGELKIGDKTGYFITYSKTFVIESTTFIPGHEEMEYQDRDYLLKKYNLHEK